MKRLLLIVSLISIAIVSKASEIDISEPFGLAFGKTKSQLIAEGLEIENCENAKIEHADSCHTHNPPKPLRVYNGCSFLYGLEFDAYQKLISVRAFSFGGAGTTCPDLNDDEVAKMYENVEQRIINKYGEGFHCDFANSKESVWFAGNGSKCFGRIKMSLQAGTMLTINFKSDN